MKKLEFYYSKNYSFIMIAVLLGVIINMFEKFMFFYNNNDSSSWIPILCASSVFITGLIFILIKFFIPAVKGMVAIEINQDYIIDNIKHNSISWNDIESMKLVFGRTTYAIIIKLKNRDTESISLMMVKGEEQDIYQEILNYFHGVEKRYLQ